MTKVKAKIIRYILDHYTQKKMRFYKYQSMEDKELKEENFLQQLVLVNYVQKKLINLESKKSIT